MASSRIWKGIVNDYIHVLIGKELKGKKGFLGKLEAFLSRFMH